jgi:peptide/nickel transport system substrate-binding protein
MRGAPQRRLLVVGIVVALLAAACGGGGPGPQKSTGGIVAGGIFRLGTDSGPDTLNPFTAGATDSWTLFLYMYPALIVYDGDLKISPSFATDWSTSEDGLTWTFHTQPDAKWSDGEPLTAEDVAWNFNTILKFGDGPTAALAPLLSHSTGAEAPDPNTVLVHYDQPVANVLPQLQEIPILPEHVWGPLAQGDGKAIRLYSNVPENGKPFVCGGPFVLTRYEEDAIALFERNPNFYGPEPHIDGFGLQTFSNDDAMVQALLNHEIDGVEIVPPTSIDVVQKAGFVVEDVPGLQVYYLAINSNPDKTTNRELLDPAVRKAFEYATDRTQMNEVAFLGHAESAGSVISPTTGTWFDTNIQPLPFDIAKANQVLDQAGYPVGPDGIRVANGHEMKYELIFPKWMGGPGDRQFQILKASLMQIGVEITQVVLDTSAAWDAIIAPNGKYLTYDLTMGQWQPYVDPDFMLSVFLCSQYGNWNDSGYCNPGYDRLYAEQGTTMDLKERQQLVWQMQEMLYNDHPYINFDYPDWIEAHSPEWDGFVMGPQGSFNEMSNLTMISIHKVA